MLLDLEQLLRVPDEAFEIDGQVDARVAPGKHLFPQYPSVLLNALHKKDQLRVACSA